MDKVSKKPRSYKWLRVIIWIFVIIISLPIFIVLLFQLGPVQNFAKNKIENFLRNKFHTSVIIGQMRLTWWNSLSLKKVFLGDTRKNVLLSSGSLDVSLNLLDLLENQLTIKKVVWDDVLINVYRLPGDSTYNYQFIIDAFASGEKTDTTSSDPMKFAIGKVSLTKVRLRYIDAPAGLETTVKWNSLEIDPEEIKPDKSLYDIEKMELEGLRGVVGMKYIATPPLAQNVKEEVQKADTAASPFLLKAGLLSIKDAKVSYDDESTGMNTNWRINDLGITRAVFDPANSTISSDDIKIHNTAGSLASQKGKATVTTVIATDSTVQTAWIFKVKNIDFDNIGFKYDKLDIKPIRGSGMDFNHMAVNNFRLQAKDLAYNADSIMIDLNELKMQEKSGFAIREGHGELLYSDKIASLKNLLLQTNKSRISSEVIAEAPSFKTVSNNLNDLRLSAVLENTYLDMTEISQIMPELKKNPSLVPILRKFISAEGKFSGTMARLTINELNVSDKDGTHIYVTGVIQNAADPDRLIASLKEIDFRSGERSIKSWVPAGTVPDSISIPSWLHLQGSGTYSKNDLLANLQLTSALGDVTVIGNANRYMDAKNSRYNVRVPVLRMDLGRLLQDTLLGKINATLSAKGTGYDYRTLIADLNLTVKEAWYNKYRFHDINSTASLNKGNYNLFLQSKDTNALATVQLEGLLDSLKSSVAGTLDLQKLDLYATRLSTTPMAAKANALIDIKSFEPRHLNGSLIMSGIQFANDSTIVALDTLNLLASDTLNQQQLAITGPFGIITADGDYNYTTAFTDLSSMVQRHLQAADSIKPYTAKERQIMDLNAALILPASLQSFAQGLKMENPLIIKGRLNTDSTLLNMGFALQDTKYNDFIIDTLRGTISSDASKLASNIYLSRLTHPQFPLEKTTIDLTAQKGVVETDLNLLDAAERRKYALGAIVNFLPANNISFTLKPELILNKTPWVVSDSNKVLMADGALRSANLTISSAGQSLSVKTVAKQDATPDLEVELNKFRLSTITAFLEKDSLLAEGVATGKATITDYDKSPLINAKLNVDSIRVMNTPLGNLSLEANTPAPEQYAEKAQLTSNDNDVTVDGTYSKELDFNVNLNKLNMASIQPLTMGAVTRMTGNTTGKFSLKGTTDNPQVRGNLNFDSVAANITAIGNYLRLNKEEMVFNEKGISFNNFVIADSLNNKAVVDGDILTKDYKDYRFALAVKADNFMAVGPQQSPDQLVYGPSFIDVDAKIRGSLDVPRVDLKLRLRDSSKFTIVIPEAEPGIADREGVIVFVDKDNALDSSLLRQKAALDSTEELSGLKGMALTAQIEVTPSSTLRVIIDQSNGDYLEVKGKANLDASMTPTSDLSLTGRYEIDEGSYNMSLNNLIKRKFNIEKGSTITLQGDPMNALVDITARYRVETSAADLVEDQLTGASDTKRNQFRQKLPIDVYLEIKNQLLKPDISFRLDMPERERNALNGVVYSRIKQINEVESELNKQVMGLLVLNSFIPENPLALVNDRGGGGSGVEGTARKSASKLISQQLNNFAGSLIKGFDVNFDLESQDDFSTGKLQNSTNLNVGVSKSLFKDRVSVTVGSSVNIEGPQQTQQASTLIGDVSVDYKITADGKYRIRGYRQNETDAIVEGQIIETGASFIYVIDYDEFRELFRKKKKEPVKEPTQTSTSKKGK